jgi:AraC-like DNA-binding protein
MTVTLPLIRAAGLKPVITWLHREGREVEPLLRAARLPETAASEPSRLVPFIAVARFATDLMRAEGPDVGCRAITDTSAGEIAELSTVVLRHATPREGFQLLVTAFPHMNSHVTYGFQRIPGGAILRHRYVVPLPQEACHILHQIIAALIRAALGWTGQPGPRLARLELTPHPVYGLDHLRPHFDCEIAPSENGRLAITLSDAVLDRPFVRPGRDRLPIVKDWPAARGDGTLKGSILCVLPGLMDHGQPTLQEIAALACMSPRTLQRRLQDEGTTLSDLIDSVRRDRALARLTGSQDRIGDIAVEVGYADIAGLSRAVRRWTSAPPRRLRSS